MTITRVTMFKLAEEDMDKVFAQYETMKSTSQKVLLSKRSAVQYAPHPLDTMLTEFLRRMENHTYNP